MKILPLLVINSSLYAAVIKHDISSPRYVNSDYKEVCQEMGAKDSLLISPKSLTEMECFNKTYKLIDFCLKKFPMDKTLTRGYVDTDKKKVICEMSDSVLVSVSCDSRDLKYCFNPKKGCEELKKIYANRLEVAHYSLLEKNLNCYFSKPIGDSLNEI
jgi:hypothetical protein